jgi:hypothetical protein
MRIQFTISLLLILFLSVSINAQTFQDSPGNENTGAFPSKWELIKGSAQIGTFEGSKVILIANKGIINPKLNSRNYLSQSFTLQFDAYFDKVTHHSEYQYYLVRFWDGAGHLVVPSNNGNGFYDPIRIFRHGVRIVGRAGRLEKIEHRIIDNNLNGKTGIWRSLTVNYNNGTLKVLIDGTQLLNLPNFNVKPAMISIEGFATEYGVNFVRAIKNIKLDGIENTASTINTSNSVNTAKTTNTTNTNEEPPVDNTDPVDGSIKINDLLDGKSDDDGSSVFLGFNAGTTDDGTNNKNVGLGFEALKNNTSGERNTATGYQAGLNNKSGSGNVFLGNNAGLNETGSNKLYIANTTSNESSALLYGEFDKNILRTNGQFQIGNPANGGYVFPKTDGSSKQFLQTDGNGNLTWVNTTSSGSNSVPIQNDTTTKSTNIYSGLEAINEGKGIGWRLKGRDPNNYGNIGLNAVDFSLSNGPSPNKGATGAHSTAFGYNTIATLGSSTAMGQLTTASGFASTAMGEGTVANGNVSFAAGYKSLAPGNLAFAAGNEAIASGDFTISLGNHSVASGNYSTAIGSESMTSSNYSTAIGYKNKAMNQYATAFGIGTLASGEYATSLGNKTVASGKYALAMGSYSEASGFNSTALGHASIAQGNYSTALGHASIAQGLYSTATGNKTEAVGESSFTSGSETKATKKYATAMGYLTEATGENATAIGHKTIASGITSIAFGSETIASGTGSIALGRKTTASGMGSTSMGFSTVALGDYSTALGYETLAGGKYSTALGSHTKASGENSTAMGNKTIASGINSTALGNYTLANAVNSVAMGLYTTTVSPNSLVIGQYNDDYGIKTQLFQIGNGDSSGFRRNAFEILKNGNGRISGTLFNTSDRRLKTNISSLKYGLNEVLKLNPVNFNWKNRPEESKKTLGLIAQEVQPIISEIVTVGDDKNQTLSVSYTELIPILIKAIQEQQAIIESLKKRIEKIEGQ